jgi:hypothetical protein
MDDLIAAAFDRYHDEVGDTRPDDRPIATPVNGDVVLCERDKLTRLDSPFAFRLDLDDEEWIVADEGDTVSLKEVQ